MASAGPHASLNLTPETDNHASTPPLTQAGCPSCSPTNGVKALKALKEKLRETFTLSSCHSTDSQMEVTAPLKIRRRRIEDRGKCGHAPIENWPFHGGFWAPIYRMVLRARTSPQHKHLNRFIRFCTKIKTLITKIQADRHRENTLLM